MIDKALAGAVDATEKRHNGAVSIWLPPQPGRQYVIGVDPAGGGVDGDYSCAEVIDLETGMQCAELHAHLQLRELAKMVNELGKEYNSALLAVERNNHGNGVLVHLELGGYPNIYEQNKQTGWYTTAVNRPEMIETMAVVLEENPELFVSAKLWNECRTFVRHYGGTTAAAPGSHDDCVMAMAIALEVRKERLGGGRSAEKKSGEH